MQLDGLCKGLFLRLSASLSTLPSFYFLTVVIHLVMINFPVCWCAPQVGSSQEETLRDSLSEAFMQAARAGVLCVASAGNAGATGTVTNSLPWAITGAHGPCIPLVRYGVDPSS
jgi:hypothetical protein